jgi:fructokinase
MATKRDKGYESVLERLANHIHTLLKDNEINPALISGLGAGLPGTINPASGEMLNGNSEIFIGKPFANDLQKALNCSYEVRVANDANLFALAEVHRGAGLLHAKETNRHPGDQLAIGIILGTGNGGGLVQQGKIYEGRHGGGAEIGHYVLYNNGRPCYCGRKGCAEQYLSGPSIEKSFKEKTGQQLRATEIFDLETPEAKSIQNQFQRDLLESLTNLASLFDPDYFVLGGGISTISKIYEGLEERLWEQVYVRGTRPRVYKHQIGDSAGVVGSAMLFEN